MKSVALATARLHLEPPTVADRETIVEYCRDPLFETLLTTPWPYELEHAHHFVATHVPIGWAEDREFTWAIRATKAGPLLGVISYRTSTRDIGFWLGAPHRGRGLMTEAASAVIDWLTDAGTRHVEWECVPGNTASASVARKLGFAFAGTGPSLHPARDGSAAVSWHGTLFTNDRSEKPGWPA